MRKAKFEKQLCISLSPDTHQRIKDLSDFQEVSQAEIVRQLIDGTLSQQDQSLSTQGGKEVNDVRRK